MSSHTTTFKVAVVTGAAMGIGRGIATRLCDDGLDIAINDLPSNSDLLNSLKEEIEAKGRKCAIVMGDVSTEEQVKLMIDQTVKELGQLDVVGVLEMYHHIISLN